MFFDGAMTGHKINFTWLCKKCGKPVYAETLMKPGKIDETMNRRMKVRCPACGHEDNYHCDRAEETKMEKV